MKLIQTWLVVIIFLICTPAFADDMHAVIDPFQEIVANYRTATPKPQLPEEARKFKVQAEFAVQEKQFDTAIELYGRALDIAPWWPEGHFNRALILAETKKYWDAMREMKRYLLLVPDAADARAAQDKIYQWESVGGPEQAGRGCPECPEMVAIPVGSFIMGSDDGDSDEKPAHRVTISRAFELGKTEVTQGQWRAIMGSNQPSHFPNCGDSCPVLDVSWNDAQEFIQKLNAKTGKQYRLPSEAEWEYACHAVGQHKYCGSDDVDSVAWHSSSFVFSKTPPHAVAAKQANAFGLYDMSGNAHEWVEDSWHDNYIGAPSDGTAWQGDGSVRVLRSGSWISDPQNMRSVYREKGAHDFRYYSSGFRLARTLP